MSNTSRNNIEKANFFKNFYPKVVIISFMSLRDSTKKMQDYTNN